MTLAILMVGAMGFTSCSDDDETQPANPISELVGKRFCVDSESSWEHVDQDGDSLVMTTSRSIQFLNDSVAILYCPIEYVYPQHDDWYSLDHGYIYMDCKFDSQTGIGTLTLKKMTLIMTGYYDEKMTFDEEEPYTIWNFKMNGNGKGIHISINGSEFRLIEEMNPIKGLQWQEFPPENGEHDNPHLDVMNGIVNAIVPSPSTIVEKR